ncbi:CLUMA_CG003132, isoform A [Clunio marinus]|uniref:CLUMA_CG003132, isoform A n=1 Tax=Clunio marinus TaxID=568069 RepID=A0A1J1HPC0_9DIPT|nr:CLUMA_CG003132, isoform A [Clunio marinus]
MRKRTIRINLENILTLQADRHIPSKCPFICALYPIFYDDEGQRFAFDSFVGRLLDMGALPLLNTPTIPQQTASHS